MKHVNKRLLEDVLNAIGIEAVVNFYSAKTKPLSSRKGIHLFLCPFHDDTNLGAAQAYIEKNDFCCHACGAGGPLMKLTIQFAKNAHPNDANDFDKLLDRIVEDLNINRESVVDNGKWDGTTKSCATINEELYIKLFGVPYLTLEKEFEIVPIPNKKAMRVPTNVEKIYFKTLYIRDKKLHDNIIIKKARSIFRDDIEKLSVEEAERLMEKQLGILTEIFKCTLPEEEQIRKQLISRKKAIDSFIAKKKGEA